MRCFVALTVPPAVRRAVAATQAALGQAAPDADVRWIPEHAFHLTLQFLGTVAEERLPAIGRALVDAAGRLAPIGLAARRLGAFPTLRRARVLWAGIDAGDDLPALAHAVAGALEPLGFARETRPFGAHLTIGRVRTPRALPALVRAVERAGAPEFGTWTASDVILYHSRLAPTGAAYETLVRVPLGERAREET